MPRRRQAPNATPLEANRRSELLRAAARLFVSKGYAATTTRDIALAVGMRPGSPFYHFRSKHELLRAAIADGLDTGYQRLQEACNNIQEPALRLRVLIRTHLHNLLEDGRQAPMLLFETRSLDTAARAEIAAIAAQYQTPWQEVLDQLAASGRLKSSAPPLRLLLFGMLNWTTQWYRAEGELSIDQLTQAVLDLLLAAEPCARPPR